jgi:hypothetical protein
MITEAMVTKDETSHLRYIIDLDKAPSVWKKLTLQELVLCATSKSIVCVGDDSVKANVLFFALVENEHSRQISRSSRRHLANTKK